VYAQHQLYFVIKNDPRCPRQAFLDDISEEVAFRTSKGYHIILLIDGNSNMRNSDLSRAFASLNLRDILLEKYGLNGPSTHARNTSRAPIDGIWAFPGIDIMAGGYLNYDEVFNGTDHRCLWIDHHYTTAFGHIMPRIVKPHMRCLTCQDPRIVKNFNRSLHQLYIKHNFLHKVRELDNQATYPLSQHHILQYEDLDRLCCQCIAKAEKGCRKQRTGQVAFSPTIQSAKNNIATWRLLMKRYKGGRVSSHLLCRQLKKCNLPSSWRGESLENLTAQLTTAYKVYYILKVEHRDLRQSHLASRTEALAAAGSGSKSNILKTLLLREQQCKVARKLRHLRVPLWSVSPQALTHGEISQTDKKWKGLSWIAIRGSSPKQPIHLSINQTWSENLATKVLLQLCR
jgi:hypothetical protein